MQGLKIFFPGLKIWGGTLGKQNRKKTHTSPSREILWDPQKNCTRWREEVSARKVWQVILANLLPQARFDSARWSSEGSLWTSDFAGPNAPWHIFQFNFATRKAEQKILEFFRDCFLSLQIRLFRPALWFSEHGTSVFSKDRISFSARRILSSNSSPFRWSSSFSWAAWNIWANLLVSWLDESS